MAIKTVYVASPFSLGDIGENIRNARRYASYVVADGCVPVVPHLLFPQFMDEGSERDLALMFGQELLSRCDEVWLFGKHLSAGMIEEVQFAYKRGIPVKCKGEKK